jgi:hypothetical protein
MYTDITKLIGTIYIEQKALNNFDEYAPLIERNVMIDLLGFDVYTAILADDSATKYTDLLNGSTYTGDDGYLHQVRGIIEMLPYFFYFYFKRDLESYGTSIGEFKALAQNAEKDNVNINRKLVSAWNTGVEMYEELYQFILYKQSTEGDSYYYNWLFKPKCKLNMFAI